MRLTVEIIGQRFTLIQFGETREFALPCVYLMAHADRAEDGVHRIHYAGQTENLADRFAGHHQLGNAMAAGATHALVLAVSDYRVRRALETVLRWQFRPPMNEEDVPTHMQAWRAAQVCGLADVAAQARRAHLTGAQPLLPPWARVPKAGAR